MGQDALTCLNAVRFPLAVEIVSKQGSIQKFTPTIDALVTSTWTPRWTRLRRRRTLEAFKAIGP